MISRDGLNGWIPAGSLARRSKSSRPALVDSDTACSEQARRIQANHRGWLVMWSPWHRTFTAFSCFSCDPLVVDRPTADGLVSEMRRIEQHYRPTRIDHAATATANISSFSTALTNFPVPSPERKEQ